MENNIFTAEKPAKSIVKKATMRVKRIFASIGTIIAAVMATVMTASAGGAAAGFDSVTVNVPTSTPNANNLMGQVLGILLTVTRFVGIALVIYGVYEIVMSFMQNQPEAKTKGIIMALAGVVMIALKSILQSLNIGIS